MVPSGPSTPIGGTQSVTPSLLRSNSGLLGGQGGSVHSQPTFPSRSQYNNVNLLGSVPNVSSFLNHSYGNGVLQSGFSGAATGQRGGIDTSSEQDPLSAGGGGMGFKPSPSFSAPSMVNAPPSVPSHGQQLSNTSSSLMMTDQQQVPQMDPQNLQHSQQPAQQFSAPSNNQPPQLQYQSIQDGLGGIPPVKLESQVKMESPVTNDQHRPQQQQQQPHPNNHQHPHQSLQSVRGPGLVKLEPPSVQSMRSLPPVKLEAQHSEHSMYLHQQQQQQQQQLLQMSMSRQSSHAAAVAQINLLQQQRSLQMQQQQHQQQLLKAYPQQRPQLQQQFAAQNLPIRPPLKPAYEVGMCARRLTQYMDQQQNRPPDNSIEYWRNFVSEYFAPNAKKKWCVSMYGSGRQANGVFPQDVWHCDICHRKPGRGFEATVEVLPRLFKIKYESGTLEELLYVDMPREHHNSSGQIVLDYAKAIQESVFEQLRVVRDGQLRIVFSSDLKICSWEFCAKRHEELIPRRLLIPQVSQLGTAAQKYQTAAQSSSTNMSALDLQNNCNMFVASARQIAKALEVPLVNDLGYTKRYVRCLQISEVVNSMKDLIDYSRVTGQGPMESLAKFPRRTVQGSQNQHSAVDQQQQQQQLQFSHQQHGRAPQQQQPVPQSPSNGPTNPSSQGIPAAKLAAPSNGMSCSVNIPPHNNTSSSSTPPTSSIAGLIHQNSSNNSRPPLNPLNNMGGGFYGSNSMPSPGGASVTLHQPAQLQSNPSPFQSPAPSSSNNNPNTTSQSQHQHQNNALATSASTHVATTSHVNSINSPAHSLQSQPSHSNNDGGDLNDTQSSVQKIIQEMMISNSQLNSQGGVMGSMGSMVNEMKNNANGMILPSNNGSLSMNGANNAGGGGMVGTGYGGISQAGMHNGNRGAAMMGNNPMAAMNGRSAGMGMVGMSSTMLPREQGGMTQQQDLGSQFLSGLGAMNGFNNLQFDWKPSP